MTKLWLLEARTEDLPDDRGLNPWVPPYDKADGFVVRADTETEARAIAQQMGGDETGPYHTPRSMPAWTDPKFSTCVPLLMEGVKSVILMSFNAG